MKTIIVATDYSPAALNAANYATEMAMVIDASVLLLHIYNLPVGYNGVPLTVNVEDIRKIADKNMTELKRQLIEKTGGKINVEGKIRLGTFFQELQAFCECVRPYAVIIGSQGTTATERILFGGHAVHAMKHLTWPIIAVPHHISFSNIKKIGLACDFDGVLDTTPVDEIKRMVTDFNAELHVLNTGKKDVLDPGVVFESGLLDELIGSLHPKYHFITNEKTDESIMEFAEQHAIDLLIVLPKRHGLMEMLRHRSHTKSLVLHSHVPVMALHLQGVHLN
jgi:nucleotide-binding universal stress UspA family protein